VADRVVETGAREGEGPLDATGATDSPLLLDGDEPAQPTRRVATAASASSVVAFRLIMLMDSIPLMEKSPSLSLSGG